MTLKMFGLGLHRYFTSGWNLFDFIVTVVSFLGLIAEILGHFPFLIVVRHLRLPKLLTDVFHDVKCCPLPQDFEDFQAEEEVPRRFWNGVYLGSAPDVRRSRFPHPLLQLRHRRHGSLR